MRLIQNYREGDDLVEWLRRFTEVVAVVEEWREIGAAGNPAFENSWANRASEATAAFYIDPYKRVWLKGGIDTGTNGTTAFTLPEGYRPTEIQKLTAHDIFVTNTDILVTVNTDGTVVPSLGSTNGVTLAGMSFRV